mgnify:CR=1 FL=1
MMATIETGMNENAIMMRNATMYFRIEIIVLLPLFFTLKTAGVISIPYAQISRGARKRNPTGLVTREKIMSSDKSP